MVLHDMLESLPMDKRKIFKEDKMGYFETNSDIYLFDNINNYENLKGGANLKYFGKLEFFINSNNFFNNNFIGTLIIAKDLYEIFYLGQEQVEIINRVYEKFNIKKNQSTWFLMENPEFYKMPKIVKDETLTLIDYDKIDLYKYFIKTLH